MFFVGNSLQKTKITFCKNLKKSIWIASIAEIKEKETAEDLKGQLIYLEKKFLPKLMADEFYYEDLKGLEVKIIGSIKKGIIKNVFDFGSGDVLEVSLDDKEPTIYIPFDKDNVDRVDLANKKIFLTPIEGLI